MFRDWMLAAIAKSKIGLSPRLVNFMSHPILPGHLEYGDTIGIVAPASPPPDPRSIDRSVAAVERMGFRAKLAPHVRQRWGFLAGADRDRAGDLMSMFRDARVKAILCVRGGYGSSRLLPLLDYAAIRDHPKALVGYSDLTSLHCALLRKSNLVSFHGPMLNSDFIKDRCPDFTLQSFLRTLMRPAPAGSISRGYSRKTVSILRRGRASGPLLGGNLSLLCATLGTPYMPSFQNKILFLEDLNEPPYRFDRMLTQLLNAGLLPQVAGVALGVNKHCQDPRAGNAKEYRQSHASLLHSGLLLQTAQPRENRAVRPGGCLSCSRRGPPREEYFEELGRQRAARRVGRWPRTGAAGGDAARGSGTSWWAGPRGHPGRGPELVDQLIGDAERRTGGRGHGQRVPDADRYLSRLGGARRGEPDPRGRLRGLASVSRPGGQRGVQRVDVHAGHRHPSGAQQARGDHLGRLGVGVIILALEQAVPFRPVQPERECPTAGVVGEHHEERGDPEPATAHTLARPWLDVCDPYRRHDGRTIRGGAKCRHISGRAALPQ